MPFLFSLQEIFVDKIHLFKFLSMRDKPWLHQQKTINFCHSTQYKLSWLPECFHQYWEIPSRKGKYPMLRTNTKPCQLIKHAKISYSIVSLVFHNFLCGAYRNGLNRGTSKTEASISKSMNRIGLIPFMGNPHLVYSFSILVF